MCIILYYIVLYYTIWYYIILCCIILYYMILYYIVLYYIILYYMILYYIVLYYIVLYYIVLYYIILSYIILHYIILYYTIRYYIIYIYILYNIYNIIYICIYPSDIPMLVAKSLFLAAFLQAPPNLGPTCSGLDPKSCHDKSRGAPPGMMGLVMVWWWYGMIITGWWFGTFFIFHNIWDNPSHWLIFFKIVKTTNQIMMVLEYDYNDHIDGLT